MEEKDISNQSRKKTYMTEEKIVKPKYAEQHSKPDLSSSKNTKDEMIARQPIEEKFVDEEAKVEINDGQEWGWSWGLTPTDEPLWWVVADSLSLDKRAALVNQDVVSEIGKLAIEKIGDDRQAVSLYLRNLLRKIPVQGNHIYNVLRYLKMRGEVKKWKT